MARHVKQVKGWAALTKESTLTVADKLYPKMTGSSPGLWVTPVDGPKAERPINNDTKELKLPLGTRKVELQFLPVWGNYPWTLRIEPVGGTRVEEDPDGEKRYISPPEPKVRELVGYARVELSLDTEWEHKLVIEDGSGNTINLRKVLFRSFTVATSGTWESQPIPLSSILLRIVEVKLYRLRKLPLIDQVPRTIVEWLAPLAEVEAVGWRIRVRGVSGQRDVTSWRETPPTPEEILRLGITGIRVKLESYEGLEVNESLTRMTITFEEEYATQPPSMPLMNENFNLYVPKLRVLLDTDFDVTRYLVSFDGSGIELVVPDNRVEEHVMRNPSVRVMLDENLAYEGRVMGVTKKTYATGVRYRLDCQSLFDLLAGKMDEDILGPDTDGDGKLELEFDNDVGYIAHVTQTMPGVGVRPYLFEYRPWRPISVWFQGSGGDVYRNLVQLDADHDWLQVYAVQNQTVRGKLKDVANANLYEFTSLGGHPALVPMVPEPNKSLLEMSKHIYNMTSVETYLPEARLFVPEYRFDPSDLPKSVTVQGLETVQTREDVTEEPQVIYWDNDGSPDHLFKVEAAGADTGWIDILFVDGDGFQSVYKDGSVELHQPKLDTDLDVNVCSDARYEYEFIKSGDPKHLDRLPGYDGIIGIRVRIMAGVFIRAKLTFRLTGRLLYSASGERGEPPKATAEGKYLPLWAREPVNFINEMRSYQHAIPQDEEVIENPFVTLYWLPESDEEMNEWNEELTSKGRKPMYGKDKDGEYYAEVDGYRVYNSQMSRLADAHVLRRVLEVTTIDLRYVGHPGLKVGDVVGIARRPEAGVHAPVEAIDFFLVLNDFTVSFQAGGNVETSMPCGYIGTMRRLDQDGDGELDAWVVERDVRRVDWQAAPPPVNDAFFF